jgi:hypothetical protein
MFDSAHRLTEERLTCILYLRWIAAIRNAILSFVPSGPPEPLFHSPETICDAIDAMVGGNSVSPVA